MNTETYSCQCCGLDVIRPITKGQRPKWCAECRRIGARARKTCDHCGTDFIGSGKRFCSLECRSRFHAPPPKPKVVQPRRDMRGELRRAYEDGNHDETVRLLVAMCEPEDDCLIWKRKLRDGYPTVVIGGKYLQAHRVMLEAKHCAPLGTQHAHHICATPACIRPEHLQPVTHRDNVAEMLARQSYLARIRELESALASASPNHPLLAVVAVA